MFSIILILFTLLIRMIFFVAVDDLSIIVVIDVPFFLRKDVEATMSTHF